MKKIEKVTHPDPLGADATSLPGPWHPDPALTMEREVIPDPTVHASFPRYALMVPLAPVALPLAERLARSRGIGVAHVDGAL
eukprot:1942990-Rhodomonas_salina.2